MMTYYYNENNAFAAAWLGELQKDGLIPNGKIDQRSITEIKPQELANYRQAHFFAGIAGWAEALRLAGVHDLECWTGSCPCQSFSTAGLGKGFADPRHLWPVWFDLIRECRPPIIFGEQVASAIRFGWLDIVFNDLEKIGYTAGACILPACSVGAPHKRDRIYWGAVGDADDDGHSGEDSGLINNRTEGSLGQVDEHRQSLGASEASGLADADQQSSEQYDHESCGQGTNSQDSQGRHAEQLSSGGRLSFWDGQWIECSDGKKRQAPAEPSLRPLAYGIPNRVGILRGAGNAIVPQVAAVFIQAFLTAFPIEQRKFPARR